jgi:hypothetical protein
MRVEFYVIRNKYPYFTLISDAIVLIVLAAPAYLSLLEVTKQKILYNLKKETHLLTHLIFIE